MDAHESEHYREVPSNTGSRLSREQKGGKVKKKGKKEKKKKEKAIHWEEELDIIIYNATRLASRRSTEPQLHPDHSADVCSINGTQLAE